MRKYFGECDDINSDSENSEDEEHQQTTIINKHGSNNINLIIFVELILLGFLFLDLTNDNHKTIAMIAGFGYMIFVSLRPDINNQLLINISNKIYIFSVIVLSFLLVYIKIKYNLNLFT